MLRRRSLLLTLAASFRQGPQGAQLEPVICQLDRCQAAAGLPPLLSQACNGSGGARGSSSQRVQPAGSGVSQRLVTSQLWARSYRGTTVLEVRHGSSCEASSAASAVAPEPDAAVNPQRRRGRPPKPEGILVSASGSGGSSEASADAAGDAMQRPNQGRRPKLKAVRPLGEAGASARGGKATGSSSSAGTSSGEGSRSPQLPVGELQHHLGDGEQGYCSDLDAIIDQQALKEPQGEGWRRVQRKPLRLGKPMDPSAEAFLHQRGVDTAALVKDLPLRASQLTLPQVQATWAVLEEYGVPRISELLKRRPTMLSVDPETNLRPKFEALGLEGDTLGELFSGHSSLPYTTPENMKGCLAILHSCITAASREGLLPPQTTVFSCIASKPRQWAAVLVLSQGRVVANLEVLREVLGLSDAQLGAALEGFPMLLVHAHDSLTNTSHAFVAAVGQEAAARLLVARPILLRLSLHCVDSNIRYLKEDLGWSAEEVAAFIQAEPGTFSHPLHGILMGHILQVCEDHMGRSKTEMLRYHASALRCSARKAAPRVAFLAQQGLIGQGESPRFMKDTEQDWARRLRNLQVPLSAWRAFERGYWEEPSRQALLEAAAAEQRKARLCSGRRVWSAGQAAGQRGKQLAA